MKLTVRTNSAISNTSSTSSTSSVGGSIDSAIGISGVSINSTNLMAEKYVPFTLDDSQQRVLEAVKSWYSSTSKKHFVFSGLAGTGKTTVTPFIVEALGLKRVKVVTFTGRAVSSFKARTEKTFNHFNIKVDCSTIHAWLYTPIVDPRTGDLMGWELRNDIEPEPLVIVDEGSTVGLDLWKDLQKLNARYLVIGDHEQLPPVESKRTGFYLMKTPDIKLETIHRQAVGNPIIELAHKARRGMPIIPGAYGDNVYVYGSRIPIETVLPITDEGYKDLMVITDTNKLKVHANKAALAKLNRDINLPTRNSVILNTANYYNGFTTYNGDRIHVIGDVIEFSEHHVKVQALFPTGETRIVKLWKYFFHDGTMPPEKKYLFVTDEYKGNGRPLQVDFGYAMTAHKAQGDQASKVIVYGNGSCFREDTRRWRYVAISRAIDKLIMIP
jgi:exodeoxyribonuclease-5